MAQPSHLKSARTCELLVSWHGLGERLAEEGSSHASVSWGRACWVQALGKPQPGFYSRGLRKQAGLFSAMVQLVADQLLLLGVWMVR